MSIATRCALPVFAVSLLFAQGSRPPALDEILRQSGLRVEIAAASARGSREFRILLAGGAASSAAVSTAQVMSQTDRDDPIPKQRSPEIGSDDLVVVVLDRQQVVRYSRVVTDPRLIRGEFPDANGNLQKTTVYRSNVELIVPVPAGIEVAELRILAPGRDRLGAVTLAPLASAKIATSSPR